MTETTIQLQLANDLASFTEAQLTEFHDVIRTSFMRASGLERKELRPLYKAALVERSRRAWNSATVEARAAQEIGSLQQGEADWYSPKVWGALNAYLDGAMGAVEACEAGGLDLGDR